jgi:hypothetical protein
VFVELQLVLSSDKLSGLRKPMLMLSLDTVDCNGAKHTQLVELTAPELRQLLDKLRAAQKVLSNMNELFCI